MTTTSNQDSPAATILVIDDEASICFAFERFFGARGYRVLSAGTGAQGLALCRSELPDILFVDVRLPDADGLDLLEELHSMVPDSCIIVITAYGSLNAVTRAIREKAFDCLVKPLDLDRALDLAEQFVEARSRLASASMVEPDARQTDLTTDAFPVIGESAAMQGVFKAVARAAATDASVLITGETGTGKDLIARSIHRLSDREAKPFGAVNCGALPEALVESELFGHRKGTFTGADSDKVGRFEAADGGTLFLDEVGELPPSSQVKLLRFLDSHVIERLGDVTPRQLDVRILAATNQPLAEAMAAGGFRQDLYYRLAVLEIHIPPLRKRREDILPLAEHFLSECTGDTVPPRLSRKAASVLEAYNWPGNVRELRNAIEHALAMTTGNVVLPLHLPHHVRATSTAVQDDSAGAPERALDDYLREIGTEGRDLYQRAVMPIETELIRRVLNECNGNQSEAAQRLGLHRNTLRKKLQEG